MSEDARARGRAKAEAVLAALDALDAVELHRVGEHIGWRLCGAGSPLPAFSTTHAEAEAWAAIASLDELKAYVVAAVMRFRPADRACLAAYLGRLHERE
jgi:hypothetical protein